MQPISRWMSHPVITVSPWATMGEARKLMITHNHHHLIVAEGDHVEGVLCGCDVDVASPSARVGSWMSPPEVIAESVDVDRAAERLLEAGVGCLPVVAGEHLVGIVTRTDIRRARDVP